MSKRMVKNAWERSYRCIKVFKSNCSPFSVNCECAHGPNWVLLLDRVLLLAAAAGIARFFGSTTLVCVCMCVFFPRRANKKGAPLVPILALPTSLANRESSALHLFKCIAALVRIHTRDRLKMLRVHFAVAGFREMPLNVRQITTRLAKPTRRQQESANDSSAALLKNAQMFPPF